MGIADLPDINEDDWNAYTADRFLAATDPLLDSLRFQQTTAGAADPIFAAIMQAQQEEDERRRRAALEMQQAEAMAQMRTQQAAQPYDDLRQMMSAPDTNQVAVGDGMPSFDGSPGPVQGPPGPQGVAPGTTPNVFSWAGERLGDLAQAGRASPFAQAPNMKFATGAVQGLSGIAHDLGGSTEALRQGDILGGVGGAAMAALSPGDVFRSAAKELDVPNQIFPQISPETPVIGGLNNPQELAGLVPEMLLPNTALENVVGRGVAAAAKPVISGAGDLARPIIENIGRAADQLGIPRAAEGEAAFGAYAGSVGPPGRGLTREMSRGQVPIDEPIPMDVFFSRLGNAIDALPQERMTIGQAKSALSKMGVKPDELRWTGIGDALGGPPSTAITKSQLQSMFSQGNVQVREIINAEPKGTPEWEAANQRYLELEREYRELYDEYVQAFHGIGASSPHTEAMGRRLVELNNQKIAAGNALSSLPMPEQAPGAQGPKYGKYLQRAMPGEGRHERPGVREVLLTINTPGRPMASGYTSGHWDPENIVVHARLTDRTLPGGRRALHVEEVQSDWHQAGRESGYQPSPEEVQRLLPEARGHAKALLMMEEELRNYRAQTYAEQRGIRDWMNATTNLVAHPDTTARAERLREIVIGERELRNAVENVKAETVAFREGNDLQRAAWDTAEFELRGESMDRIQQQLDRTDIDDPMHKFWEDQYQSELLEHRMAQNRIRTLESSLGTLPPRAPFEKTPAWTALAMKRLLRMASEEGYDVLSWTPAQVQGERYGNAFQEMVNRIEFDPNSGILYTRRPNGQVEYHEVSAETLPNWIGADRAQRLFQTDPVPSELEYEVWGHTGVTESSKAQVHVLDEDAINVQSPPSEGMRLQYDMVMPQVMADIGKPWGARSGIGEIELWPGGDRSQAHMVEITPEMRQSITEQGFPLFVTPPGDGAMRGLESPFFSPAKTGRQVAADLAIGTAGGAVGAATGPEDQTWEDRAKRFAVGASVAGMFGPTARAPRGALAIARRGIERSTDAPLRAAAGGEVPPPPEGGLPVDLRPDEDPLPPPETATGYLERVLSEMTPAGRRAAQQYGTEIEHRAPWMGDILSQTDQPPPENRWSEVLRVAQPDADDSGAAVAEAMDAAEALPYQPPVKRPRTGPRDDRNLGGTRALENLPEGQQEMAAQGVAELQDDLRTAHGFRTEKDSREAAERLMRYILPFAREAKPNEPVNEALLRAGRAAWAQSHWPSYYAMVDYSKMANDPNTEPEVLAAAKQAMDYWEAVRRVLGRYAGEIAPSESARAFRSMQDVPGPLVPEVGGGSIDEVTEAAAATNRGKKTPREKAYEDLQRSLRQARRGEQAAQDVGTTATQRTAQRAAGKKPNGPLAAMGLEWDDIMRRTGNEDADRTNLLAGLEELGGYRMRRDWLDRAMKLDLGDGKAVDAFWAAARKAAGVDDQLRPFVKFDPNIEGQSYLGGADTITKAQALKMVSRELIKDADEATAAVREAKNTGASPQQIARLEEAAKRAYERMGLRVERWSETSLPILRKAADSVRARIEKEWPADRKAGSGAAEQVEKKRQLLGIFDQEIKKEQKLAGMSVTGLQDLMSFGTSNVLMTPRFVQASILESALSSINEPFQSILRGQYRTAGQQAQGIARAFGLINSGDITALGEGIKAPAMVNALKGLRDIGPMEAAGEMRQVAEKGAGHIRSDSPNAWAKRISPMHRVSRGISEAFQTGNYFGEVNRLAHEVAEKGVLPNGRRIEQITDEAGTLRNPTVRELLGNLPQEIVDEALKRSRFVNEGGDPGRLEKYLGDAKGLLNKPNATGGDRALGLFANLMFPFVYGLRPMIKSGVATLFSAPIHGSQVVSALRAGDSEAAKYAAKKFAIANSFNAFIAYHVISGNITGHGPTDPGVRQALMEATDENGDPVWRPDSIRFPKPGGGNFWVKYTSMPGPVSIVATVMGNVYDAYAFDGKDMESSAEMAARIMPEVGKGVLDNTYFRDMISLVEAMNATGGASGISRVAGQVVGRFVPGAGALRLGATLTDPYQRLTSTPIIDDILSGIPGARQTLPAQVSPYTGRAVESPLSPVTALGGISGNVYGSPERPNPAAREAVDASRRSLPWQGGIRPSEGLDRDVFPRTFTRGEQSRGTEFAGSRQTGEGIRGAQAAFGRQSEGDLLRLINSPAYQRMTPQQQAAMLSQTVERSSQLGRYAAEGAPGIVLDPEHRAAREGLQTPQFRGVSGSPDQIAQQNQRVRLARETLSQLSTRYGRAQAMNILQQTNPEMLRLAIGSRPVNRDLLWMQEQERNARLGVPADDGQVYIPDFGTGGSMVGGDGRFNRMNVPPSMRS